MRKVRTVLVALVAVFCLGLVGAPAAPAAGDSCGSWSHASKTATGCVFVSTTVTGTTAKVRFSFTGNMSNNCLGYQFDYVRLVKASNGAILKANETDSGPSCVGVTLSSGQSFFCGDVKAVSRYRFLHSVGGPGFLSDGHTSGWIVRSSGVVGVCP